MIAAVLSPLEIASGVVTGPDPSVPRLPRPTADPRRRLEDAVLPFLRRQPCCVSFSGGRDSSTVLALATTVARRHGLPDPIPVTLRYPDIPEADESAWQEDVIRHIGIREWERIDLTHEIDFIGPFATELLREHGLLWPANIHTHVPIARAASGGSVLTGFEGDGLFGAWRWAYAGDILAGRRRPSTRDIFKVAYAYGPESIRRYRMQRGDLVRSPWMTPQAELQFGLAWARHEAQEPVRWGARVRWWARRRYLSITCMSLDKIGSSADAVMGHPLLDRDFLSAVAATRPFTGPGDRARAMQQLFGDLLPEAILRRESKAWLTRGFWGHATRQFTRTWNGEGINPTLVDADALKRVWQEQQPSTRTATILQSVWLSGLSDHIEQPRDNT